MSIQIQLNVCRACLNDDNKAELVEFSLESDIYKNFQSLINSENSSTNNLPTTFCQKCITKIKLLSNFKKLSLDSEKQLLKFVHKINQDFKTTLLSNRQQDTATVVASSEEQDLEYLLQDEENVQNQQQQQQPPLLQPLQEEIQAGSSPIATSVEHMIKSSSPKVFKPRSKEKTVIKEEKTYANLTNAEIYATTSSENEQHIDEANMFDDKEIYDIMEIEGNNDIYVDEAGNTILNDDDDGNEFILVNYKSSNDDLTQESKYILEEEEDDDEQEEEQEMQEKPARKKHVQRMPREVVDRYAQSTDTNQHICTKCVKVFSTRTNLIRHIQSHDGNKPYVCEVCKKGFTQSGSLKQHMYIHSGERPYRCNYCDKAFTQAKSLKFHLRRHMDEKPFACSECNSCFRQRDGLKRHLKTRHNIELKYERSGQNEEKIIAFVNITADEKEAAENKTMEIIEEDNNEKKMEF